MYELFQAALLGIVEGITEFLPVSSTGHILLLGHFLGFESTGKSFEVLIQLGAILAIVTIYFGKLLSILVGALKGDKRMWRFILGVLVAFLPAAFAGVLLHDLIKTVLFDSPALICLMLVVGGVILLFVDRMTLTVKYKDIFDYPPLLCLGIGLFQTLALVPGVSRSGATIVGSLLMGTDKRSAAEFTFFLAMPTMGGAFAYDLYKNWDVLNIDDGISIAIGFALSFIVGAFVVKRLLDFVTKHGFAFFAYWRIAVGFAGFAALSIWG